MNAEYPIGMTRCSKRYWKEFEIYCSKKGINYFDINILNQYLYEIYNCSITDRVNLDKKSREAIRAMLILIDINNIKETLNSLYKDRNLNEYYQKMLMSYLKFYQDIRNNSEKTIDDKKDETIDFFKYLINNDIDNISKLNKDIILNYLENNKNKKMSKKIKINWNLRSIFMYLNDSANLTNNFDIYLPKIKRVKQRKLPAVFEKDDVIKTLNYLKENRGTTPASYRNYAMILIAAKLGIRKIDIMNLKWSNIDWKNNSINIIQQKTKKQLSLPLPNDVGEAIIEYIKEERPFKIKNENDYIFIRHRYPLTKLSRDFSLSYVIEDIFKVIDIPNDKYKQKGLHSFRFTLATELLNENVPIDIISSIVGHSNLNSTKTYIKVSDNNLQKCFLEVDYE